MLNYNISGAETGTSASTSVNNPSATFQGSSASEWNQTITTTLSAPTAGTFTVDTQFYYQLDGSVEVELGNIAQITSPLAGTITTVFTPAFRDLRWTLAAGGEFTGTRSSTNTTAFTGVPGITTNASSQLKVRYDGRESVTVPAGTYSACKFTENDGEAVLWFDPASGASVKSVSTGSGGSVTLELTSGSVNGAPI